jgi:rSAM/selenodomain-associated transferase 1
MPVTARKRALDDDACLVVFLKAPEHSKRRLAAEIGGAATTIAHHLIACALEDAAAWRGPVVLAPAAKADADWVAQRSECRQVVVQHGDSLGERINHVDRTLRSRGYERLIYIGADCPMLDQDYLAAAAAALDHSDAVLGPAADGGVVLMATRRPWPDIGDLAWSTRTLRAELVERLAHEAWSTATLATLADVDTSADLRETAALLAADTRPARRNLAAWLAAQAPLRGAPA